MARGPRVYCDWTVSGKENEKKKKERKEKRVSKSEKRRFQVICMYVDKICRIIHYICKGVCVSYGIEIFFFYSSFVNVHTSNIGKLPILEDQKGFPSRDLPQSVDCPFGEIINDVCMCFQHADVVADVFG